MMNLTLFLTFLKIGFFGYGGGLGMLPLIMQSMQELGVMSDRQIADLVAISQVTPGPIVVNGATFAGFLSSGWIGATCATIGVVLPCFILMYIAMTFIDRYRNSRIVNGIFSGIRPVTTGLIAGAVIFVAEISIINGNVFTGEFWTHLTEMVNIIPCIMTGVTVLIVGNLKVNPIVVIIAMGVLGAFIC